MISSLKNKDIINIFEGAHRNLEIHIKEINDLNVFPVPDGDTGTNMHLTLTSAINEIKNGDSLGIKEICHGISSGALKGARGNSGVILSQILKGFCSVLSECKTINTKIFAKALKVGAGVAYDVVTNPKEGTILTVIRIVANYAVRISNYKRDILEFFKKILKKGEAVLEDTPNMLPVLKKAGVVDAGGKGLLIILYGMYNALAGIEMIAPEGINNQDEETQTSVPDVHNLDDITYAYCTELFIVNLKPQTTLSDIDKLRDKLAKIGDSLIVVGDLHFVKIHVHTSHPDKVINYALQLGEIDKPKIENMLMQAREFRKGKQNKQRVPEAVITICQGEGIKAIFNDLNISVIEGGQTMNPSVEDIKKAVETVNADNVFVLPNNSNIILAAEQVKDLVDCNVIVIPTKSIPEGISAAINYSPDESTEENTTNMTKAISNVKTGEVSYSVKDTEMDGLDLHQGDVLGIFGKTIVAGGSNVSDVTKSVIKAMVTQESSTITLYFGDKVDQKSSDILCTDLQNDYPDCDIAVYYGGQSHYYYFIAVE